MAEHLDAYKHADLIAAAVVELERAALLTALKDVLEAQRAAVALVNKQGAAFPAALALACEKARATVREIEALARAAKRAAAPPK